MGQLSIPAVFMRGGTSKGLFFKINDLPISKEKRANIFLNAMGSPDSYGRQLNGMGGGVSSVSKAVIVNKSNRNDADLDYTFAQIAINKPIVDYSTTCGNLSAAVGPFAIDTGILKPNKSPVKIRIFNTNLKQIFHAYIPTNNGKFEPQGNYSIPGVTGTGSKIRLDYLTPGGSTTGKLLPTGCIIEKLNVPGEGCFEVSMVDASAASVFIDSSKFSLTNSESVIEVQSNKALMTTLEKIRRMASVAMGLSSTPENAALGTPKICLVSKPIKFNTLSGSQINKSQTNLIARYISIGQVHLALPITGAMCLAAASCISGSICHRVASNLKDNINLGNPSGIIPVRASVTFKANKWHAETITVYRTARALMRGEILIPKEV